MISKKNIRDNSEMDKYFILKENSNRCTNKTMSEVTIGPWSIEYQINAQSLLVSNIF